MTAIELAKQVEVDRCDFSERQCSRFAALLQNDLDALSKIEQRARDWDSSIRNGDETFDFKIERRITATFEDWLQRAEQHLRIIEIERETGCDPALTGEYENTFARVKEEFIRRKRAEQAAESRYHLLHDAPESR